MANSNLFRSRSTSNTYAGSMTRNAAGGSAFKMNPEHALAQYAFTGTFSNTCYADAHSQLERVIELCGSCDDVYIAQTAIAAREHGYMKDMPAMLAAYLHSFNTPLLRRIFPRVINNGKMLKNFVQIIRSGLVGRRGLGSSTKNMIRRWLENRDEVQLLYDNIGGNKAGNVSLSDILRMVRPKPSDKKRSALYAWIRGASYSQDGVLSQPVRYKDGDNFVEKTRNYDFGDLPDRLQAWLSYKADPKSFDNPPKIPFQMLTSLKLDTDAWIAIARNMSWQELRQNLNTLQRHGVFDSPHITDQICEKLRSSEDIKKANAFPYQLLAAYLNTGPTPKGFGWTTRFWDMCDKGKENENIKIPKVVRQALEDAMEIAVNNVPAIKGDVFVCPDTSGSMGYPITGERHTYSHRGSAASKVRCVDVAGLITSAILRKNPMARALPFSTQVHDIQLNPMQSVVRNAEQFAELGGGGTACSEPLRVLNALSASGDVVVFISDYESWADARTPQGTAVLSEWNRFKVRNPAAKLVCVDLTPRDNKQLNTHPDILHVGGFSDQIFSMIERFVNGKLTGDYWVNEIKKVDIGS